MGNGQQQYNKERGKGETKTKEANFKFPGPWWIVHLGPGILNSGGLLSRKTKKTATWTLS
jgi:hypothetical protein